MFGLIGKRKVRENIKVRIWKKGKRNGNFKLQRQSQDEKK
jgi:hypothetical protein